MNPHQESIEIYKQLAFAKLDLMVEKFKQDLAKKLKKENEDIVKLKEKIKDLNVELETIKYRDDTFESIRESKNHNDSIGGNGFTKDITDTFMPTIDIPVIPMIPKLKRKRCTCSNCLMISKIHQRPMEGHK